MFNKLNNSVELYNAMLESLRQSGSLDYISKSVAQRVTESDAAAAQIIANDPSKVAALAEEVGTSADVAKESLKNMQDAGALDQMSAAGDGIEAVDAAEIAMSDGAIAGIVLGSVAFLGGLVAIIVGVYVWNKGRKTKVELSDDELVDLNKKTQPYRFGLQLRQNELCTDKAEEIKKATGDGYLAPGHSGPKTEAQIKAEHDIFNADPICKKFMNQIATQCQLAVLQHENAKKKDAAKIDPNVANLATATLAELYTVPEGASAELKAIAEQNTLLTLSNKDRKTVDDAQLTLKDSAEWKIAKVGEDGKATGERTACKMSKADVEKHMPGVKGLTKQLKKEIDVEETQKKMTAAEKIIAEGKNNTAATAQPKPADSKAAQVKGKGNGKGGGSSLAVGG